MLVIRHAQLDGFSRDLRKKLEARLETHLRSVFPKRTASLPPGRLTALVRSGIDRAEEYSVKLEVDVRCYLEFMLCYGPEFDKDPKCAWAGEILQRAGLNGTEKINELSAYELFVLGGGPQ